MTRLARLLLAALRWHPLKMVFLLSTVALLPWLLVLGTLAVFEHVAASGTLLPIRALLNDELLVLFFVMFLGYGLTVGVLVSLVVKRRFERLSEWMYLITTQREDPAVMKGWDQASVLCNLIRDTVIHAHEASARYQTLNAMNRRINSTMELEHVLPEIIRSAVELIGGTAGVLLLRGRNGRLRRAFAHNFPSEVSGIPGSTTLASQVLQRGESIVIEDYSRYEGRWRLLDGYQLKCIVGIPLVSQSKIIGVLIVTTQDPAKQFGQEDIQLLTSFSNQAAIAIRNAGLYSENLQRLEESRRAKKELADRTAQLRGLLARTVQAEDETRRRIAAEIHDGITQLVVGALCQIQSIQPGLRLDTPDNRVVAARRLELAQSLLKQSIDEMYRVTHGLRPPCLDELGLIRALQKHIEEFKEVSGLQCRLHVVGPECSIEPDRQMVIYRVVQEALTNVGKHAGARHADVHLRFGRDTVAVTIQDDGRGFTTQNNWRKNGRHLGICDMEERAHSVGGSLEIRSTLGAGTEVLLELLSTSQEEFGADQAERADLGADGVVSSVWPDAESGPRPIAV